MKLSSFQRIWPCSKIRSEHSTIFLEISASAVITRVVKSEFEGAVCNSLIVRVVIVPNKIFRALRKKRKKEEKKDKRRRRKKGLNLLFSSCCASCSFSVTTFVPRLTSLAWFSLGPAQYRRWTIIQLAFVTNVVLVLPCFSPPTAPHIRLQHDSLFCCCGTDTLRSTFVDLLVAVTSCLAW